MKCIYKLINEYSYSWFRRQGACTGLETCPKKKVSRIFIGPGNAGTSDLGTNLKIDPEDFEEVKNAVIENGIDMVIVGPEAPLVEGIHDFFLRMNFLKDIR